MRNDERKKIVMYGSPSCADCGPVKEALESAGVKFAYVDITSGMPQLQYFLKLRDVDAAFADIRGSGKIGIPAIQVNDAVFIPQGAEGIRRLVEEQRLIW